MMLRLGDLLALGDDDERGDHLAPLVVGDADDGDLGDGRVAEDGVLHLDRGDVLAAGDDHVLLAVGDGQVAAVVDRAAVAGVEPAAVQRLGRGVRVLPVAGEDGVALRQHLAGLAGLQPDAQRRHAGPGQLLRPLLRLEVVELRARPVDGEQRRGLGEAVDLVELPAELRLDPGDRPRRRRRAGDDDPHPVAAGDLAVPVGGGLEDGVPHRRRPGHHRHAVLLDPAEDLGAVDLAQHHLPRARGRPSCTAAPSRCSGTSAACAGRRRGR